MQQFISNAYGNSLMTENAFEYMAQADQALFDFVSSRITDPQDIFDIYCTIFENQNHEEFVLNTENPQW